MKIIVVIRNICFLVLISGCQKIIEPKDLPNQDPRLVLNCLLYPDSVVSINVSSSKSILSGKDYKFIDNATCIVYEDGVAIEQLTNSKNGDYYGTIFPKINKSYTIKVSAAGYETIEGSTSVPDKVVLSNWERYDLVNSNYVSYNNGGPGYNSIYGSTKCLIKIKDDLNVKNYYTIQAKILLFDSAGNFIKTASNVYITNNNKSSEDLGFISGNTIEVSDLNLVNGSDILLDLDISLSDNTFYADYAEVSLLVSNTSEDLYKYKTTLANQTNNGISLFAEPVLVYNNIKNGMGIIGSMNTSVFFLYKATISKN